MRRSNNTTLQDVAREAGVSAMTVSVVLNNARSATRVSDATRARIEEVAARLRYRRNAAARGMKRGRMDTLGVVAPFSDNLIDVLRGMLEAAAAHGQTVTVFSITDWARDQQAIANFGDGRVDGMILVGPHLSAEFATALNQHIPFVAVQPWDPLPGAWNLDIDDEGGAYAVVRYLIEQGHRRIAHLTGPLELSGARRRYAGYRRALEEAGVPFEESLVVEGGFMADGGSRAMRQALTSGCWKQLPTAIFCANDACAVGCFETLREHGLRVPDDISLVGFDDAAIARMIHPQLTTVRQPFTELGRRAVGVLLAQIDAESGVTEGDPKPFADEPSVRCTEKHIELLNIEVVVRGSVGPPTNAPVLVETESAIESRGESPVTSTSLSERTKGKHQ